MQHDIPSFVPESPPLRILPGTFVSRGELRVSNPALLGRNIRELASTANFGSPEEQAWAQWAIREFARESGVYPASIHRLYKAVGYRNIRNTFTVPAMNLRTFTFDLAVAAFRQAMLRNAGAIIFEIARSEIKYTGQRPAQYASSVLAAAIAAGYRGPVFLQGDHFQVSAKRYQEDPGGELNDLKELIKEAIAAGFYNIDVDTSTLVDLDAKNLWDQQFFNAYVAAELAHFIRAIEPPGITISIGAEIGEVGGHNSTFEELVVFLQLFREKFGRGVGLSKISIQTGTSHGGIVLPDGSIKDVAVDFDVLRRLGQTARREFRLGGAVQHGASTLPIDAFGLIRGAGAIETHLATAFQMGVLRHIPDTLRMQMARWLEQHKGGERKNGESDEQFWHRNSKHALGPHADRVWSMSPWHADRAVADVESQFRGIFDAFGVRDTLPLVQRYAPYVPVPTSRPDRVGHAQQRLSADATPDDLAD